MCGRFTFASAPEVVGELLDLGSVPELPPRYNIAPTQRVATVLARTELAPNEILAGTDARMLCAMRWGLIPSWADDPAIGSRMINARAETVSSKPAFRAAFKRRRCLVLADGFYEWKRLDRGKQPYHIRLRGGGPFAFAGLWERWNAPDGTAIDSCTIITTEPNELLAQVHDRTPVILNREDFPIWLDASAGDLARLSALLCPLPSARMECFPVSTLVNRPANDSPQCIERART